jgi:hypothetical protein
MVRGGVSAVLVAVSALLLLVAAHYAWHALELGTVEGDVPNSWGAALGVKTVWPVLVWSLLFGVAGLVAAVLLGRGPDSRPERLVQILAVVHFGAAVALLAMAVYLWRTRGFDAARGEPVFYWALALMLVFVVGGVLLLMPPSRGPVPLRLTLMSIGGVVGLLTLILGFVLPLTTYSAPLAKGLDQWRKDWDAVVWPALAVFGSLVLMFVSLLLGKGLERQNQTIRRVIYGYNAVMTGLLLLAVLSLVNVLAYAEPFTRFFGRPFDWTEANLNAISPATRNLLNNLQEPVTVISLLRQGTLVEADARTLLDNCKTLTPKFTWRHLSPEPENEAEVTKLMEKYGFSENNGLLVMVGGGTDSGEATSTFIKAGELVAAPRGDPRRAAQGYEFTGEGALLNALQSLLEGKMTIYLTQGHGELSPDGGAAAPPPGMGAPPPKGPLATLREKLMRRRGVEVKTLRLDGTTKSIPDAAAVVMIVRPTREFGKEELAVLRTYLRRTRETKKGAKDGKDEETVTAGRLFVLAEPYIQKEGDTSKFLATGLEPLLGEYGVKLGMNRIIAFRSENPTASYYEAYIDENAPASTNPIALAFASRRDTGRRVFPFTNVRTVEPLAEKGGDKIVDRLFVADLTMFIRVEKDADRDPAAVVAAVRSQADLIKAIDRTEQTIAVAVSDRGGPPGAPRDEAHAGVTKDTPRMVVFGTSSWVANDGLAGRTGVVRMDLVNNCISWLREKGALGEGISVDPKERKLYDLNVPPPNRTRFLFLPVGLMLLGVMGLGLGVWVVRRR